MTCAKHIEAGRKAAATRRARLEHPDRCPTCGGPKKRPPVRERALKVVVTADGPTEAERMVRPRMVRVRKERDSGTGKLARFKFIYEPVAADTPRSRTIVPAALTDHEYAGVLFLDHLASAIASVFRITKPASIFISWPKPTRERVRRRKPKPAQVAA